MVPVKVTGLLVIGNEGVPVLVSDAKQDGLVFRRATAENEVIAEVRD
jgi:hypothetical protein